MRGDVVCVDLQIGEVVAENAVVFAFGTPLRLPQSGNIRLAVHAWRGSSQVRLPVFRAGNTRVGIVHPLCVSIRKYPGKDDSDDGDLFMHSAQSYYIQHKRGWP